MFTLNTIEQHAVAYGVTSKGNGDAFAHADSNGTLLSGNSDGYAPSLVATYNIGSYASNAWKSSNPNSGVYEADASKTLDSENCGNPICNQGGTAVVETIGADVYNGKLTDRVAATVTAASGGANTSGPKLVERIGSDIYNFNTSGDVAVTLNANSGVSAAHAEPTVVEAKSWDGTETCSTLTAHNANGSQRMPDKENFNAIVEKSTDKGFGSAFSMTTGDYMQPIEERSPTLLSRDYKDPAIVAYGN